MFGLPFVCSTGSFSLEEWPTRPLEDTVTLTTMSLPPPAARLEQSPSSMLSFGSDGVYFFSKEC
jgi:hypothetical protein